MDGVIPRHLYQEIFTKALETTGLPRDLLLYRQRNLYARAVQASLRNLKIDIQELM